MFTYYGIMRYDYEGTLCSSTLGYFKVAVYRLISVIFFTLLYWLNWLLCPNLRVTFPVEVIGVSDMAYVTCVILGSHAVPLGTAWCSDPGNIYWRPRSRDSSCQASLVSVMLEDLFICYSFVRLKFSCVDKSECYSNRFSKFTGTVLFLVCSTVDNMLSKITWYWG